ncbi:unnamed protein product [Alopecurus aequalis]
MQAGGTKTRFGRCPYCRAMICQSTTAAIYYCSKCRTPIRGKNTEPTEDETENALSSLEILSAVDTSSVFSDEETDTSGTQASVIDVDDGDQPPPLSCGYNSNSEANSQGIMASSPSSYRGFGSPRAAAPRSNGLPRGFDNGRVSSNGQDEMVRSATVSNRVDQLRAASRRTRRASSNSDPSILRRRDFSVPDDEEAPSNARDQQLWRSPLSSRELGTSASVSRLESGTVTATPLNDPAFNRDLLHALDKLRGMIAAIELQSRSASSSARGAVTRRESRIFRRLESRLVGELPAADALRWNAGNYDAGTGSASWSSASSSNCHGERHAARPRKKRHCFPLLGAAPFVVCGECSELLQAPNLTAPSRRGRSTKLRCGGCEEVLELTLPAAVGIAAQARRASRACSATRMPGSGNHHGSGELKRAEGGSGGEQQVPLQLHRLLGYDSASQLLESHRYSNNEFF